ncbi:MAG: alpha/beta fold hydrolase [Gammaproteobacteria bacterium]|nr:alpha/beta fold hydrolase [Gammaproteobacteria bacterium]
MNSGGPRRLASRWAALLFMVMTFGACLPAAMAAEIESLPLDNGEYRIPGTLTLPGRLQVASSCPAVLMLHGTGSNKDEVGGVYKRLAGELARAGIASLRIDFAGTGDSSVDYRQYTLSGATRDARVALKALGEHVGVDPQRLGVLGFSQGGLIAQVLVVKQPDIRALATWSSVANDGIGVFQPLFDEHLDQARRDGYAVVNFPWRGPLNFSLEWFDEVRASTALSDMAGYHGRLLAIAGLADDAVPYEASLRLAEAAGSTDARVLLIKGADHIYHALDEDRSQIDEVIEQTVRFFREGL